MEVVVPAEPEPIKLDIKRTALIVVDMQKPSVKRKGCLMYWEPLMKRR